MLAKATLSSWPLLALPLLAHSERERDDPGRGTRLIKKAVVVQFCRWFNFFSLFQPD